MSEHTCETGSCEWECEALALEAENAKLREELFGGDMALSDAYDRQEAEIVKLVAELNDGDDGKTRRANKALSDYIARAELAAGVDPGDANLPEEVAKLVAVVELARKGAYADHSGDENNQCACHFCEAVRELDTQESSS